MLKVLLFFLKLFVFWILFFFLDRLIFLLINYNEVSNLAFFDIAATFVHAQLLDISMTAYIMAIPSIVFIFYLLIGKKNPTFRWLSIYTNILVVLFSIISVVNFNIYREWGTKINAKALEVAITTPNEALASSASSPIGLSLFILVLLIAVGVTTQRFILQKTIPIGAVKIWARLPISLPILALLFLMIRGGISGSPNNQSMAYFSKDQILNLAAVNTEWNLLSSIIAANKTKANPYVYYTVEEVNKTVADLYAVEKDTTLKILKTDRPNVVLFIMESFTADLTHTLGDIKDITPSFDSLTHKGLLFSNIYSTGNRTDKGFIGSLAGFPTLASVNVVKWPEKTEKLPSLSRSLNRVGYENSFFYGGESEFDNYKAFLLSHDVHKIVDRNSFKGGKVTSWGQFDGPVFSRQLQEMKTTKQPFFSTILTLTNHEPFAVPGTPKFGNSDNIAKFKSTAYYTDSCIGSYLNEARKQSWYKNTLFLFIADHGHIYPKNRIDVFAPERYHIPFLMYGDVIKEEYQGRQLDIIGSQSDLAATVLRQLNISSQEFKWSKDLLNPYVKPFAFFSWDNGMGFIDRQQCVTFDNTGKVVLYNSSPKDEVNTSKALVNAKSYLQLVYEEFLKL